MAMGAAVAGAVGAQLMSPHSPHHPMRHPIHLPPAPHRLEVLGQQRELRQHIESPELFQCHDGVVELGREAAVCLPHHVAAQEGAVVGGEEGLQGLELTDECGFLGQRGDGLSGCVGGYVGGVGDGVVS